MKTFNRRQLLGAVIGLLVGILAVGLVIALVTSATNSETVKDRQTTNGQKLNASAETLELIKSCTTPGQPCYERGQAQTAEAVGDISQANALAAAAAASCAKDKPDASFAVIYRCTVERAKTTPPTPPAARR